MGLDMERFMLLNRWMTPDGTVLTSYHGHDYVSHTDKNGEYYFVDGGTNYIRSSVNNEKMKDLCVYSDDDFSKIREVLCRGTFDEHGNSIWIPICNMSNPHLENCITYYSNFFDEVSCRNRHVLFYITEVIMRWLSGKYIDERKYTEADKNVGEETKLGSFIRQPAVPSGTNMEDFVDTVGENIEKGVHTDTEEGVLPFIGMLSVWARNDRFVKETAERCGIRI